MIKAVKVIAYIVLLCFIFFLMKFLHSYELFILLIALIAVPVILELLFFAFYKRLKFSINANTYNISKGSKEDIVINIKSPVILNKIKFDFKATSKFYDDYLSEFSLPVKAFVNNRLTIPFHFINVGKYNIKAENIKIYDTFGIFSKKLSLKKVINIVVMPNIVENTEAKSGAAEMDLNWAINSYSSYSGDICGVREYIPGDRLNTIHWKASAKAEDFLIKDYQKNGSDEYIVLFDFIKAYFKDSFDILYSVGNKILDYNRSFYLMWICGGSEELSLKYISTKEEFNKAVELLYNSYPIYEKGLTLNLFKKKFGSSKAIYIGESRELI